jgi:hypothetical protein
VACAEAVLKVQPFSRELELYFYGGHAGGQDGLIDKFFWLRGKFQSSGEK